MSIPLYPLSTSQRKYINKYKHLAESVGVFNSVVPVHNKETDLPQKLAPNVGPMVVRHFQYPAINITAIIQHSAT